MSIDLETVTDYEKLIIEKGACDYEYIMKHWKKNDSDFQKVFYDFYLKARWSVMSNKENQKKYFETLKKCKPKSGIKCVLDELENMKNARLEFSIASKILHTRNPSLPIYDSKIRKYLSKVNERGFWSQKKKTRDSKKEEAKSKIVREWEILCDWYNEFLEKQESNDWIAWFDENFPSHTNIAPVKKIDFIIWACGDTEE